MPIRPRDTTCSLLLNGEKLQRTKHQERVSAALHGSQGLRTGQFVVVLAALIVAAFPGVVLGLKSFVFRDFGLFAYPLAYFQRQCFWAGELPSWNPYNSCGIPFLAQWNTMSLYPPALLYLVPPLAWGLNFFCLLHLFFGGLGMFLLARRYTRDTLGSALAGIAFPFGGVAQNLLMWPSHMAAFSWMPWVVMLGTEACRVGGRKLAVAALAGALQMLAGGPESIFFTWCFVAVLVAFEPGEQRRMSSLLRLALLGALVIGLSAAQLIPFVELALHSQRDRHFSDLRSSMPGTGWMNYLVPLAFGSSWEAGVFKQDEQSWTSSYYVGIGVLLLVIRGVWQNRERRVWLFAAAGFVALILAHGDKTPFYGWWGKVLPILKVMAFPVKFVLVPAFAAPLLAAHGLARMRQSPSLPSLRQLVWPGTALSTLILMVLFWQWHRPSPGNDVSAAVINGIARIGFLAITVMVLGALLRRSEEKSQTVVFGALLLITWLDLRTHVPTQNPTADPSVFAPGIVRQELAMNPQPGLGGSRVMLSPTAEAVFDTTPVKDVRTGYLARRLGYFSNCNLLDNVPKVTGFFSLYPYEAYQLSLLLYLNTNVSFPRLADFLSVSHITAPGEYTAWRTRDSFLPMVTAGQTPVFLDDTNTIARLITPEFDPARTVFLPPESRGVVSVTSPTSARTVLRKFSRHQIEIETEATQPCLVVIAQTYYFRWRAYVDGGASRVLRANYAFMAVEVPAGTHRLRLAYEDRGFLMGACLSGGTLLALLWMLAGTPVFRSPRKEGRQGCPSTQSRSAESARESAESLCRKPHASPRLRSGDRSSRCSAPGSRGGSDG